MYIPRSNGQDDGSLVFLPGLPRFDLPHTTRKRLTMNGNIWLLLLLLILFAAWFVLDVSWED